LSYTVVKKEGCQKSKTLPHTAKFKREVVQCAEEKGNHKAVVIFRVDKSSIQLGQIHEAVISKCDVSQKKFIGSKKQQVSKTDDAVLMFSSRYMQGWNKLYCIVMACRVAL
jgi:hypothetical protein